MIPEQLYDITELEEVQYASQTYKLDQSAKTLAGKVDDKEAVTQSILKLLATERYSSVIYDSDYGIELESLIGEDFDYVISELPRRITEALSYDDRVITITEYTYTKGVDSLEVSMTIETIYGEVPITMEVAI